ncbi:acid-sensing ion channel 2-like [Oculina patagonica]
MSTKVDFSTERVNLCNGFLTKVILKFLTLFNKDPFYVLCCSLLFRDNLLELRIYYESLTFSDVRQVASYDLYSLLGDVGGQIGLFLGASLLTLVEYLDLCAMVLFTKFKYRNT